MIVLTSKNLGERHRELNARVSEALENNIKINEIINEAEVTDIDKLYKIGIASHNKDIDYILEILKCGDCLYIKRALKCLWLYEDTYFHVINAENLNDNIFPYMSIRMKKQMLSSIAMHIRNEHRAASFYSYCIKHKMPAIGFKFLNITSKEFKLEFVRNEGSKILTAHLYTETLIRNFVRHHFDLATCLIEIDRYKKSETLYKLRYLYSVSSETYLNIMEEYEQVDGRRRNALQRFGLRLSKEIMVKHKNRVLEKPNLYVNILNQRILVKYSTVKDAKKYVTALLPETVDEFWMINFCNTYKYLLDIIPEKKKWNFVKQLFHTHYPRKEFEMKNEFYHFQYYKMLSVDEREKWALRHIDQQKDFFGNGKDYIWYKFVNFDKALAEIKKYIMITPEADKRLDMLNILVESSRDQEDLIKLLRYYYDRHVNEIENYKVAFINQVLSVHNIFEFDPECWEDFNKLLYSLEIYTEGNIKRNYTFTALAVLFHILHKLDMPKALLDFVEHDVNHIIMHFRLSFNKLSKVQSEIIYQYLLKLFVDKLQPFNEDPHNKILRDDLRQYVFNVENLISVFPQKEKERPEIVTRFLDIETSKREDRKIISAKDLYRFLKTDATLAVDALSHFEQNVNELPHRLNLVLRKLKIYFPNEVSQKYFSFFDRWLSKLSGNYDNYKLIKSIVFGLFQIADEKYKISLMDKYCPSDPKINLSVIDRQILFVQEAICRLVGYSRPPVPLENVLKYIKGDYTKYCLPLFNMYILNLPLPQAIKFTEATLNAPLSVQKHGLRAAFKCFAIDDLKNLVIKLWKNTKNVSLRMIIYKLLFERLIIEDDTAQLLAIYEPLKLFTSELHQDDHDDVFELIWSGRLPFQFMGEYLQTAWDMVIKLPEKPINIKRQTQVVNKISENIELLDKEFLSKRIIEEHINEILKNRELHPHEMQEFNDLYEAKWNVAAKFISIYETTEELQVRLELLSYISKSCIDSWYEKHNEKFHYQEFYFRFIRSMGYKQYWSHKIPILQHILDTLMKSLPIHEIYMTVWDLQVTICYITVLGSGNIHEVSKAFANEIGTLLKERLEKCELYTIFLKEMAELLNTKVYEFHNIYRSYDNFNVKFCQSLVDLDMKEAHLITLMILPVDVEDRLKKDVTAILRKIQAFDDVEVKSLLYSKFVLIDFKNRL